MKKNFVVILLFFSGFSLASPCWEQFSGEKQKSVRNIKELGSAMTKGLKPTKEQKDLFHIYQNTFFPDPSDTRYGIEKVFEILENYPKLSKPSFREQILSLWRKSYQKPEELSTFVNHFIKANAKIRVPFIRSMEQIPFWTKVLNLQEAEGLDTKEKQEALRLNVKKRLAKLYAETSLDKKNWDVSDIIQLYQNLQRERERQIDRGEDSSAVSKAMLDLIHTAGFSNRNWLDRLKHKDPFVVIEALKQIIDYREYFALELGFKSFNGLKASLKIKNIDKNFYDQKQFFGEIESFKEQIKSAKFFEEGAYYRVRALSLEESPFRGCMASNDCSSSTYFEKGLDPNFIYWTKTDSNFKSSGQITTVLGQAEIVNKEERQKWPYIKKKIKTAFVDKIQGVSEEELIPFLLAIKNSLSEKGYTLALPLNTGGHNGLSNDESLRVYTNQHILPQLGKEGDLLKKFSPHSHKYGFSEGYSRAYRGLDLVEFSWSLPESFVIESGSKYGPYVLENLTLETFIQNVLDLRHSNKTEDLIIFLNNVIALRTSNVPALSDQDIKIYLKDLLKRANLNLKVRKKILYGLISLERSAFDLQEFLEVFKLFFTDKERRFLIGEMGNWKKINNGTKKDFFRFLNIAYDLHGFEMEVFENLFKNKKKNDHVENDFFFVLNQLSLDLVKLFLDNDPNLVNIKNRWGKTALHIAVGKGDENMVKLLAGLDSGSVHIQDNNGNTALDLTVEKRDEGMVKLLSGLHPDLVHTQDDNGNTVLHIAVEKRDEGMVKLLSGLHPNLAHIRDDNGNTVLHIAVEKRDEGMVKLLSGLDPNLVNVKNFRGKTALHFAVLYGDESMASLLLNLDHSLLNIQDEFGQTALHIAVGRGDKGMAKLLVGLNPDLVNIKNHWGKTALCFAVEIEDKSMAKLLAGFNPDLVHIQNKRREMLIQH